MYRSKSVGRSADRVTEKGSALQKDPALIVYQARPLNVGAPPACARQTVLTPKERFFVRNHSGVPQVDVPRYRLTVTGMVQFPLDLSLDELRATFPEAQVTATLQCAGHRRKELAALQPIPGEIPWGADAMSTTIWRGVPLREVCWLLETSVHKIGDVRQHNFSCLSSCLHEERLLPRRSRTGKFLLLKHSCISLGNQAEG